MAWSDDWTVADYQIKGADYDALYNALVERVNVIRNTYTNPFYWNAGATALGIGVRFPDGFNPLPTPPPDHPPKIPPAPAVAPFKNAVDIQDPNLYSGIQSWIALLCSGSTNNTPGWVAAARKIAYDGKQVEWSGPILTLSAETPPNGWLLGPGGYTPPVGNVVATVDDIRVDAGLQSYKSKRGFVAPYAFRRRCPRQILNPKVKDAFNLAAPHDYDTIGPKDTEGNDCPDGANAWAINTFPSPTHGGGALIKYDGGNKIWNFIGQRNGEMPDILDSDNDPPNYAVPGLHLPGDYIDGLFLTDIKLLLKNIYRFTSRMFVDAAHTDESGHGDSQVWSMTYNPPDPPPYPNFAASVASAGAAMTAAGASFSVFGSGGAKAIYGQAFKGPLGDVGYQVQVYVYQIRWTGDVDDTVKRDVEIYLIPGDYDTDPTNGSYLDFFDFAAFFTYQRAKKVETLTNPAKRFRTTQYWPNNSVPPTWPVGAADPPIPAAVNSSGDYRIYGFGVGTAYYVADYSVAGGFQYL